MGCVLGHCNLFKFWEIKRNILVIVQDGVVVAKDDIIRQFGTSRVRTRLQLIILTELFSDAELLPTTLNRRSDWSNWKLSPIYEFVPVSAETRWLGYGLPSRVTTSRRHIATVTAERREAPPRRLRGQVSGILDDTKTPSTPATMSKQRSTLLPKRRTRFSWNFVL